MTTRQRPRRVKRRGSDDTGSAETRAFSEGKRAATGSECPYRERQLRAAWERGVRFGEQTRAGKVPLDTAKRIS